MRKPSTHFGLWISPESIRLISGEHGQIVSEPPIAAKHGRRWVYGQSAETQPNRHLFEDADFPQQHYFEWFLSRVYPLKRMRLHLISSGFSQSLSQGLWQHVFSPWHTDFIPVCAPIDCLAYILREGIILWCDQGLAQIGLCRQGRIHEHSAVGYGQYLSRALRQYAWDQYQLYLSPQLTSQAWPRLGQPGQQLTLGGLNAADHPAHQLFTSEELKTLYQNAFAPVQQELHYYQQRYPTLPCHIGGSQALFLQTQQSFFTSAEMEPLLIQGIQTYLRSQS